MRFQHLYEQFLLEHNVVNTDAIKQFVAQFSAQCHNENAKAWFDTTLARTLERDDQTNVPLNDNNVPRNAPSWLEDAIARGDDLRVFEAPMHMVTAFDHLADYFNSLDQTGDPIMQNRARLLKVTVEMALKKAEEWTATAAKKAAQEDVQGMTFIFEDGPYKWMKADTLEALKRDGAILHHCTAQSTYDTEFKKGTMGFIFLHDAKGIPHVCVSFKYYGGSPSSLDQCKGKQNLPPIGRYSKLCANFINTCTPDLVENAAKNGDIQRMGLVIGSDGKLTTATEDAGNTKVVFRIGNVRVYETVGQTFDVRQSYYNDGGTKAGGGADYWFNSHEGDLFKLNVGSNGKAYINYHAPQVTKEQLREYLQKFLNEYFTDGAPGPLDSYSQSTTKNLLVYGDLNLRYNALTKKYGTPEEIAEKQFEVGGLAGYLWADEKGSTEVRIQDAEGVQVFSVPISKTYQNVEGKLNTINWMRSKNERAEVPQKTLIDLFNTMGLPPAEDIGNHGQKWRMDLGIFYSAREKKYGKLTDVCEPLWEKAPYTIWKRIETDTPRIFMMKKGQPFPVFEVKTTDGDLNVRGEIASSETDRWGEIEYKTEETGVPKLLKAAMNAVPELSEVMHRNWHDGSLDDYEIFHNKGKWHDRDKAGSVFHKFDDGFYFATIEQGEAVIYTLYDAKDTPLFAVTIEGKKIERSKVLTREYIRGSRHALWLMNELKIHEINTVDGGNQYGWRGDDKTAGMLWKLGLFFDTRSYAWKLVQDGKMVYDGSNFRAVNFRNRVFLIDNQDGCLGWFKKDGNQIGQHDKLGGDTRTFYKALEELINNTPFWMSRPGRDSYHGEDEYRKHGFMFANHGNGMTLTDTEKLWPTETVLKLPKGFKWVRMATDKVFHDDEKEDTLHGERYSLQTEDGKSFMRAIFDDEYLSKAIFSTKDTFESYHTTSNLKEMKDGPQKKAFIALLEKMGKKLHPMQAREFGYFRTRAGTYKAIKGNKALEGFLNGLIDFGDGHEFRLDKHDKNEWTLGVEDPNSQYEWDKFKPYLKVKLDDDGIESVTYHKKEIKRKPSEYMPYIHKLMKIFATISGE